MKTLLSTLILLTSLLFGRNDVPSCYDALHMSNPNPSIAKELFILIDQTTPLDKNIMKYTYKNMMKYIKNGSAVTIASFSANSNGKYTNIVYSGSLENLLEEHAKQDISKKVLRKYQGCMNGQYKYAKKKATKALVAVLKGANKELPHSDIIKSLYDISTHRIKSSKASEKTVLLVSDMIEHSSITSFYHKGTLKKIHSKTEMKKIKQSKHLGDFGSANIYVIGAGIINKKGYRNANSIQNLTEFWKAYFSASHANLKAFGTPMLFENID